MTTPATPGTRSTRTRVWVDRSSGVPTPRQDQRRNVRLKVRLPVRVLYEGREWSATMRDLSARDVNLATRAPLHHGGPARVEIDFEHWTFHARIDVRFHKRLVAGCQVGCQFVDLSVPDAERMVEEMLALQREIAIRRMADGRVG